MFRLVFPAMLGIMNKGRVVRLLALAAMVTGLVAVQPAQAAQPNDSKATPGGVAAADVQPSAGPGRAHGKQKKAAAADDEWTVSSPGSASANNGARTDVVQIFNNTTQGTNELQYNSLIGNAWSGWKIIPDS